jgi:Ca2+-binding EF-hand superfamily protein
MKRTSIGALCLALCAAALPGAAPPAAPRAPAQADDTQDVLYVGQPYPVLIRLHLRVDGRSALGHWEACLEKLFRYLDHNNSGALDRVEAARAPTPQQMNQFFQGAGYFFRNLRARPGMAQVSFAELDQDRDGQVSLDEFRDYYLRNGAGAVQLQNAFANLSPGGRDPLTDVVFSMLDTNRDGKLSRAELDAAEKVLMRHDVDDNELVSRQELGLAGALDERRRLAEIQLALARGLRLQGGPSSLMLVARDNGRRAAGKLDIARDVLARYDRDRDGKLSREEIGFPQDLFDRLDRNRDGKLDVLELVRWVKAKPAGEFTVQLQSATVRRGRQVLPRQPVRRSVDMSVTLEGVRINVVPRPVAPVFFNTAGLESQFNQLDAAKRGFITRKQVEPRQYANLRGLFDLADRNGDGRLTRQEVKDYLALVAGLRGAQVNLSIVATGQGLFEMLDANGDGQLSIRELRNAWKRLAPLDRDGDGCISRSEFPFQFQLTVGQSAAAYAALPPTLSVRSGRPGPRQPARGPLWFRKMDRNGDGDVSLREWLGTREQFDEIDTDRDGLISVEEAEAYDVRVRRKSE